MPLVKQVGIKNPSTGNYDMRDVGAEAQNVAVSYDSNGTIIEDINATGVTVSSTKSTAKAIKDVESSLSGKVNTSSKGVANGVASLDANGLVPTAQLPSLDNFIEGYLYNGIFYKESTHTTVITGETEKFYVDLETEKLYRYTGSAYTEVSEGAVYENKTAAKDGTDVSLVTTGDKYNWNHKEDAHFVGTQAQWEALNSQQKAQYTIVDITDDYTPGGGGHTIINASGTSMTQRAGLQFDGLNVSDDSGNDKTVVTAPTPDYVDTQYNPSTTYSKGMTCISGNVRYRYINSTASSGHQPPNTTYWEVYNITTQFANDVFDPSNFDGSWSDFTSFACQNSYTIKYGGYKKVGKWVYIRAIIGVPSNASNVIVSKSGITNGLPASRRDTQGIVALNSDGATWLAYNNAANDATYLGLLDYENHKGADLRVNVAYKCEN